MKLASLFDGSGTAPLAATMLGMDVAWLSEIEPYPCRVTAARIPGVPNHGDITKIDGSKVEPVDVIVGGSPCQDLSVAGKQAGLQNGARSHLFYEMVRVIKEMREATNGKYPRWVCWENVPGALSSNKGEDFRSVVEEFCRIAEPTADVARPPKGKWASAGALLGDSYSFAWRIVDAQYFGVPQRRRRIYAVLDLAGQCAPPVLFEREGMPGDYKPCGAAWERIASAAEDCAGAADRYGEGFDGYNGDITGHVSATLGVNCGSPTGRNGAIERRRLSGVGTYQNNRFGMCKESDIGATLRTPCGGDAIMANLVMRPIPIHDKATRYKSQRNGKADGSGENQQVVVFRKTARAQSADDATKWEEASYTNTLNAFDVGESRASELVCSAVCIGNGQLHNMSMSETANALDCMHDQQAILTAYSVRRLTPLECCRLQGFPDWWEDGVEGSDSARYKMWGNGMALPCMLYVLAGIRDVT